MAGPTRARSGQLAAGESLDEVDPNASGPPLVEPPPPEPEPPAPIAEKPPPAPDVDDDPVPVRRPRPVLLETEPYAELRGPNGLEGYEQRGAVYGLNKQLRARA